jgi:hypothetical protein
MTPNPDLVKLIEYTREIMMNSISVNGINHSETIKLSQQLDSYIVQYQRNIIYS